jgi:hypothetical protein
MDPIKLGVNKTTTFLLPMLFPESTHDEIFSNYFKQAYVGLLDDEDREAKEIILEFDGENTGEHFFTTFIEELEPKGLIKDETDTTLTFSIEDFGNEDDYALFLNGKYSMFNDEYKKQILEFWKEEEGSLLWGILYNDGEVVAKYTDYLDLDIIDQLKETHGESWPPPNLFVDELYE